MPRLRGPDLKPRKNAQPEWLRELCKRLPGESETEWTRRRNRETMRYWRSKDTNKEHERFIRKNRYWASSKEAIKKKEWQAANLEKVRGYSRKYFYKNRARRIQDLRIWAMLNPERLTEVKQDWYEANQGLRNHYASLRRARVRRAIPKWADLDKIEALYKAAVEMSNLTGTPYHVDHIIPIAGKIVSGLHVETNLRIIPGEENVKKRNKLLEHLLEESEMPKVSLSVDGVEIVSADVSESAVEIAKAAFALAEIVEYPKWLHHPNGSSKIVHDSVEAAEHLVSGWFHTKEEAQEAEPVEPVEPLSDPKPNPTADLSKRLGL